MDKILELLFHCDLSYRPNQELENRYSFASEEVSQIERSIKAELPPEGLALVKMYQEKVQRYQRLDCQLEFEKGFVLGAQIMLGVLSKKVIVPSMGNGIE